VARAPDVEERCSSCAAPLPEWQLAIGTKQSAQSRRAAHARAAHRSEDEAGENTAGGSRQAHTGTAGLCAVEVYSVVSLAYVYVSKL